MATSQPQDDELGFEIVNENDLRQTTNLTSSPPVKPGPTVKDPNLNESLQGFRVELKWSSGRWYRGTVCGHRPEAKTHKILYDDGDIRWYYLPEMVFRFVSEEEDDWIKC